ncbi:hypothetical protein [Sphingomonas sp. SUN039]|uniref:hypothetical protein n=1 Tax=Sphingomonas sp. SUN039 TaxID=2937787 RepID=UPI0021640FF4|nr:hypothetical protein [Sphingomonas sp. SUN039]UVO52864.1 hypothetical protein M0209_01530 [Sphingomonas sp. SUN039]
MTDRSNVALPAPVPGFLRSDVAAKLAYLDRRDVSARLAPDGASVSFSVTDIPDADREQIANRVLKLVHDMTTDAFEPEIEVMEVRAGGSAFRDDPMPALAARGEVFREGDGYYSLGPQLSAVIAHVDDRLVQVAAAMSARTYRFPALISPAYLERVQYFKNFPHSLSFVTHLNADIDDIQSFSSDACCIDGRVHADPAVFARAPAMLSPTVCHHLYAMLENQRIEAPGLVATAHGHCFRFEASNMYALERAWNFTMREIMFVGDEDFVAAQLEHVRAAVAPILAELDLSYSVETANDPFFVDTFRDQAAYQAAFELKQEVRADIPYRGKSLAIASFNRHGNFFGRTLDIRDANGEFACTGCFGAGFERIAFALVAQHGPDPQGWPSAIRAVADGVTPELSTGGSA